MNDLMERPRCACGKLMHVMASGFAYCDNCDRVQGAEALGARRNKTREDVRFEMHWVREEKDYVDNTKQGEPNE